MKRLYEKHNGKLVRCAEYRYIDRLPIGWHLVEIKPGVKSMGFHHKPIAPDRARLLTALREFQDVLVEELGKAGELKPFKRVSAKFLKAWEIFKKNAGEEISLYYDSRNQIAENAIKKFEILANAIKG